MAEIGEQKQRNEVWDIVKGLGILFVVAGHGFSGDISKFVNLFHIPLFFFVSGLVFKYKDRTVRSMAVFIRKCFKSLWLPSLLYGSIYVLLHNTFVTIHLYDLDYYSPRQIVINIIKHIGFLKTEPLESAMWFLTAIFAGRCLLYGVLWLSSFFEADKKKQTLLELLLISILFGLGCIFFYREISLPGNADNACSLVPFMYAGYKMKKANLTRIYLIIPCFVIMVGLLAVSGQTLRMSRNEIVNPLFFLIASTAGVCFTYQLASLVKNSEIGTGIFCYLGRNTIPILCVHLLAFRLISFIWIRCEDLPITMLSKHPIIDSSFFWGILYTLAGLVIPLIIPAAKNKIIKLGRIK